MKERNTDIDLNNFLDDLTIESGRRADRDGRSLVVRRQEAEKKRKEQVSREKRSLGLLE